MLGGTQRKAKVAVAPRLPIPVLLGRDLYDVRDGWKTPETQTGLMVETRAKRREAELSRPSESGPDPEGAREFLGGWIRTRGGTRDFLWWMDLKRSQRVPWLADLCQRRKN